MLLLELLVWIPLTAAVYRDTSKSIKSLPAFTNSLVNLGKMDISFYLNAKPEDFGKKYDNMDHGSFFSSKADAVVEEPCACSNAKYLRDPTKNNPSELLNKILTSKSLFSFNKEPETSVLCCESHESVREDTIYFEMNPKQSQVMSHQVHENQFPLLPFIFENIVTNKPAFSMKPKTVEIFLFPKKKEFGDFDKTKKDLKKDIQLVGGKETRNDFKNMNFVPPLVLNSVKKDLGREKPPTTEENTTGTTAAHPNTL